MQWMHLPWPLCLVVLLLKPSARLTLAAATALNSRNPQTVAHPTKPTIHPVNDWLTERSIQRELWVSSGGVGVVGREYGCFQGCTKCVHATTDVRR